MRLSRSLSVEVCPPTSRFRTLPFLKYLIQENPVPGTLRETYQSPVGVLPTRKNGKPHLMPRPCLVRVPRNPPDPNIFRNPHPTGEPRQQTKLRTNNWGNNLFR